MVAALTTLQSIGVGIVSTLAIVSMTAFGRRAVARLFKGQSVEAVTQVSSSMMVQAQAGYEMAISMRDEYKAKADALETQLAALQRVVTGQAAIERVAVALDKHNTALHEHDKNVSKRLDGLVEMLKPPEEP